MSDIHIKAMNAQGVTVALDLQASSNAPWTLRVSGLDSDCKEFTGNDLFEALVALRREVEARGMRLLCAGAHRDVYPSGMSRSMGSARNAYVMKHGQPAVVTVDIFEYADPDQVSTIEDQRYFRDQWAQSLHEKFGA
jgi:hypothetical protein